MEEAKISKIWHEKSLRTRTVFNNSESICLTVDVALLLVLWGLICFLWEVHWEPWKEVPKKLLTSVPVLLLFLKIFRYLLVTFEYIVKLRKVVFSYEKEGLLSTNNLFYERSNIRVADSMGHEMHNLFIPEKEKFYKLYYLPKE